MFEFPRSPLDDARRAPRATARGGDDAHDLQSRARTMGKDKGRTFAFVSELNMPALDFIADKDTDAYRSFHMARLGTRELEIVRDDLDERTGIRTQVMRTVPNITLPRLVRGMVPNGKVEFVDTREFVDSSRFVAPFSQEFTTVNNITKHSVVQGVITVTSTGAKTCRVDVVGECRVSIRGVGGIIEGIVIDGIRKAYTSLPEIVKEWVVHKAELRRAEKRALARTGSWASLTSYSTAQDEIDPSDENDVNNGANDSKNGLSRRQRKSVRVFMCCTAAPAVAEDDPDDTAFASAKDCSDAPTY